MEQHLARYTKYIHEDLSALDVETATYKEHLHKSFEWFACMRLSIQYDSIFLRWEDVPPQLREEKGMSRDMGIDAWDIEGNRVSQMKLYQGCISWRHFSTFLGCCFKFKDAVKILYRTQESQLCSMIQSYVEDHTIVDKTVEGHEFRSECKRIQSLTFPSSKQVESFAIRPYQAESIAYLEKGKEVGQNVYLCIPTGCGKTVILLHYHLHYRMETLLVLVPRVVLMEQWGEECDILGIKPYLIGTGQHRTMDQYKDETIVICVYDSFPNIYDQMDRFKRVCIDEAHHVKIPERYMETEAEHDTYDSEDQEDEEDEEYEDQEDEEDEEHQGREEDTVISYMKCIQSLSDTKRVIYLSATLDPPTDDSLFFEYKVRQAIDEGYLCDYQFVFPIFEQEYVTNEHLAQYLIHKQHESHCVIYAPSCKEGKEFTDMLNQLRKGCAGYIDKDTPYKERQRLFAEFESGAIHFLVNIRILVEGFNAPHIRSIFFLKVSTSEIFIIQAIGRALRPHSDKRLATIYVPFTQESDAERIQTFLHQLSTYDERIKKTISEKRVGGYLSLEHGEDVEDEDDEKQDDTADLFTFRYNLIVDRMGKSNQLEEMWLDKLKKVKEFIDKNKKRPHNGYKNHKKIIDENISKQEEIVLCNWLGTQKQNYKKNMYTMKNETIKKLWKDFIDDDNYKKYMIDGDKRWVYHLEKVKKYMDTENKRPNQESKDANIKTMGRWCQANVVYYQTKKGGIRFKLSRSILWNEFINDPKYREHFSTEVSWKIKLDMVKKYIDTNNDRPTYYKCKNTDNVDLGKWLDHQISNYNRRIDIVHNNTEIRLLWEQFIEKYKIYFMTQEERWIEKLDHCKKFIKEHKKRPNTKSHNKEERTMAYWIVNQIANYREKCEILGETESLQQLWIPFIADVNKLRGVLSFDDKIEIIRLYDSGITGRRIAEDFGKSPAMISLVIKDRKKYENIVNIPT